VHYPFSSYPYYITKLVDLTCFSLFYKHVTERNTIKESSISKWLKLDPVFYLTESMAVVDTLRMMMDSSSMVLHPMRRRTFILRLGDTRLIIMEEEAIMAPLDVIEHFKSQVCSCHSSIIQIHCFLFCLLSLSLQQKMYGYLRQSNKHQRGEEPASAGTRDCRLLNLNRSLGLHKQMQQEL